MFSMFPISSLPLAVHEIPDSCIENPPGDMVNNLDNPYNTTHDLVRFAYMRGMHI
jgi:hypothetical protein